MARKKKNGNSKKRLIEEDKIDLAIFRARRNQRSFLWGAASVRKLTAKEKRMIKRSKKAIESGKLSKLKLSSKNRI
ncbi:MAG: hypothetical protein A3I89_00425 [Candidatus Harrisonbacteria bacterium RIFCSPLOWO2_02_FULL_41_11]|uniref:Uncharacterized protein n=1 Tax=Candidatus Harrisonbacteria bacterium RIFCSPHIGHO2_02_FULL_42_16 TaxID=1798404 RepID=A0A1G1ZIY4_9BACT|nr:MAG: hypothetical protein A3B92_02555 [Candidatus Harrisonbacteria bacterium RIFCSPHIGHO2_02_FULL_42_16]OGY67411.1 MAG: hypothetical protein A3I89_00425 [Candidatus Harrisonbacteria bacterium RIFCSPLOWO2_02_FULL_41_11]